MLTDAGPRRASDVAESLQRTRAALVHAGHLDVTMTLPVRVFWFRRSADYQRYAGPLFGGRSMKTAVSIVRGEDRFILVDGGASSIAGADRILKHELVHQLTPRGLPLWLSEGIAELYSSVHITDRSMEIGLPLRQNLAITRRLRPIPIRELLAAGKTSRWYLDPLDQRRFYAWSWLLTHYLMIHRPEQMREFMDRAARQPLDEAFTAVFKMRYDAFTRELQFYARRPGLPSFRVPLKDFAADVQPTEPRALTADEQLVTFERILHEPAPRYVEVEPAAAPTLVIEPAVIEIEPDHTPEQLERYDAAVAKLGSGDLKTARKLLDELLTDLKAGELRDEATALRAEIERLIRKNRVD